MSFGGQPDVACSGAVWHSMKGCLKQSGQFTVVPLSLGVATAVGRFERSPLAQPDSVMPLLNRECRWASGILCCRTEWRPLRMPGRPEETERAVCLFRRQPAPSMGQAPAMGRDSATEAKLMTSSGICQVKQPWAVLPKAAA